MKAEIKIKKMSETAVIPTRGSEYAAGYDLYADLQEDLTIQPHETAKVPTGVAMELPIGTYGAVFARSGLASKEGLRPANCVGVCDADYRGQVFVALHNDTNEVRVVTPKERIAQYVLMPFIEVSFVEAEELSETVRGAGGFGSTGKQ